MIAVRQAAQEALDRARAGGGPTLIEAVTYRLGDHTTADDATRYRDSDIVKQAWEAEPILRLRKYLTSVNAWDKAQEEQLGRACYAQVEEAVAEYMAVEHPGPDAMFDQLYATLPSALEWQRVMALAFASNGGAHG